MHNFVDNTKNPSQTLDFTTNFFLWILGISTCVWWITMWINIFVSIHKQSYPHYPQFYMPYPPSELSTLYPQLFSTYPHVIHSLSTILSTFFSNVVDIFYRLLSSSLLKFFIIFSIISLYGLIGSFLEIYHIPTSGVTND